ncbi:unnamed protein product [Brassica rapa subsp. narinosa]
MAKEGERRTRRGLNLSFYLSSSQNIYIHIESVFGVIVVLW